MKYALLPVILAATLAVGCSTGGETRQATGFGSMAFDVTPLDRDSARVVITSDLGRWSPAAGSIAMMCNSARLTVQRGFSFFYIDQRSRKGEAPGFRITFYKTPPEGKAVFDPTSASPGNLPDPDNTAIDANGYAQYCDIIESRLKTH